MRYYETFYGIHANDWTETFGSFSNHHKLLVKDYISGGADTLDSSTASETYKFLYPQHIKKTYFIEGVITGHITFESSTATGYLCAYRVTVCKVHENTDENELFSTGWKVVNHTLGWDAAHGVPSSIAGELGSVVYPFWIDAWTKAELGENERIYLKVESTCTISDAFAACDASACTNVELWHSNDATWEDVKVTIPFRM
jgi:hypothetical protein